MSEDFEPGRNEMECPTDWRAKDNLTPALLLRRFLDWLKEQTTLIEAFCVAVSFHVLMFPLIWFIGWALPWPKAPAMTTVIEINLERWPEVATPEKIEHLYEVEMSKARKPR